MNVSMPYKEWVEFAVLNYDLVSKCYNQKVYEAVVENKQTHQLDLVQLTLREVMNRCDGTIFEEQIRRVIMKSVYTGAKLEIGIRKIMDIYFEV